MRIIQFITARKLPSLQTIVLSLLVVLAAALARPHLTRATPDASLSLDVSVVSEGNDFATRVLGLPWDMNSLPYPGFTTTLRNFSSTTFSVSGGLWSMTATNNDPNIWILWPSIKDTQHVLRLGDSYPINASTYDLLTLRMCSSDSDYMNFLWWKQQLVAPGFADGVSDFVPVSSGCKVYTINMAEIATTTGYWAGSIMGLRVDPSTIKSNLSFQLDWVRLTSSDFSNVVPVRWSNVNPGTPVYIYASPTSCGVDGTLVGIASSGSSSGTFNWGSTLQQDPIISEDWAVLPLPESFEPGQYTIFARENGAGPAICAPGTLEIHKAPLLTFQKPSYFSGPDYASEALGDPWGMNNAEDVERVDGFTSLNFSDGLFYGTSNNNDARMVLNTNSTINTSKYKYATFRMFLNKPRNFDDGWVQRFVWWYLGPTIDPVITEDMVVYEGWHTYSIDLSQALFEPGGSWTGYPTAFRFDPHEIGSTTPVYVDFITLTGDERVPRGASFPIVYETKPASGVSVTFYYDTDKNPANGRTPIGAASHSLADVSYAAFLPLVTKGSLETNLLTGERWLWDTSTTPAGTYYISADVSDGVMTTTWYSDIPVTIY